MSSTPSSDGFSFGTVDILEVGQTYRVLSKELVCKALAEANPGQPPESEQDLGMVLADGIVSALHNIHPKYSREGILPIIKATFKLAFLKKRLEEETGHGSHTLRKKFYEQMCSPDPGVPQVTHPDETNRFARDDDPDILRATDFLLDEDRGAVIIPDHVQQRADEDWDALQRKAREWSSNLSISATEACGEVIAACIAVEVHTGGNPNHTRPYKHYLYKETALVTRRLQEVTTLSVDTEEGLFNALLKWLENMDDDEDADD